MICDRKVMKQDFNIIRIETSMDMGIGNRRKDWTYIEAEELLPGGVYNVHDQSLTVVSIDENEMDRIRWEVLDFANACRNHIKHTKDEFHHIISLNEKYHNLLDKYQDENGVFDAEYGPKAASHIWTSFIL